MKTLFFPLLHGHEVITKVWGVVVLGSHEKFLQTAVSPPNGTSAGELIVVKIHGRHFSIDSCFLARIIHLSYNSISFDCQDP